VQQSFLRVRMQFPCVAFSLSTFLCTLAPAQGLKQQTHIFIYEQETNQRTFGTEYIASETLGPTRVCDMRSQFAYQRSVTFLDILLSTGADARFLCCAGEDDLAAAKLVLEDIAQHVPSNQAGSRFIRLMTAGKKAKTHHYIMLAGVLGTEGVD